MNYIWMVGTILFSGMLQAYNDNERAQQETVIIKMSQDLLNTLNKKWTSKSKWTNVKDMVQDVEAIVKAYKIGVDFSHDLIFRTPPLDALIKFLMELRQKELSLQIIQESVSNLEKYFEKDTLVTLKPQFAHYTEKFCAIGAPIDVGRCTDTLNIFLNPLKRKSISESHEKITESIPQRTQSLGKIGSKKESFRSKSLQSIKKLGSFITSSSTSSKKN
ncbi:hypothetical protein [Holospora curviuscula]|uniref:Uncharacterized protein n=1 Tax=Holospora curviuscula TaxID=1082868 RepID=A0A2S5RA99_9PROT|nr:hypothetical protein [Holospora curviuscula]PPE04256.1 hypothetical protein HCUR_00447 [Holospora curviuscula]